MITGIVQTATCAVVRRRGKKKRKISQGYRRNAQAGRGTLLPGMAWHSIAWHIMARHEHVHTLRTTTHGRPAVMAQRPVAGRVDHRLEPPLSDSQQGVAFWRGAKCRSNDLQRQTPARRWQAGVETASIIRGHRSRTGGPTAGSIGRPGMFLSRLPVHPRGRPPRGRTARDPAFRVCSPGGHDKVKHTVVSGRGATRLRIYV